MPTSNNIIKFRNGSLKYYEPIIRRNDSLKPVDFSTLKPRGSLASDYYISPATGSFDEMVETILYDLNITLMKLNAPSASDVSTDTIEKIIQNYAIPPSANAIRDALLSNHSGTLLKVAANINHSTLDQVSRAILSERAIFFYLSYRAIVGFNIKDVEGIASTVLESTDIVKSYINSQLVDKVIQNDNLSVTTEEIEMLKFRMISSDLSYAKGNPTRVIKSYFDSLKDGGPLYKVVRDFLDSSKVILPRGVNKEVIIEKMVDYLVKIGFKFEIVSSVTSPSAPPAATPGTAASGPSAPVATTSGTVGSGTAGSGTAGSGTAGSGTAGTGTAGSGTAGTGTAGSGTAGSGTSGSGTAGSGTAASSSATSGSGAPGSAAPSSTTSGTSTRAKK